MAPRKSANAKSQAAKGRGSKNQKGKQTSQNKRGGGNQAQPNDLMTRMEQEIKKGYNNKKTKNDNLGLASSSDQSESDVQNPFAYSLSDQVTKINKLLSKNKVTAENVFNFQVINVNQFMRGSENQNQEQNDFWKKLSLVVDTGSKVYGYKVDGTHNQALNVFGRVIRQGNNQEVFDQQQNQDPNAPQNDNNPKKIVFKSHLDNESFNKYIEKMVRNINMDNQQLLRGIDPILIQTKRKFDQGGLKTLLMNSLGINKRTLEILINPEVKKFSLQDFKQKDPKPTQERRRLAGLQMSYPAPGRIDPRNIIDLDGQENANRPIHQQIRELVDMADENQMMEIEHEVPRHISQPYSVVQVFTQAKEELDWTKTEENYDFIWELIQSGEFQNADLNTLKEGRLQQIQNDIINQALAQQQLAGRNQKYDNDADVERMNEQIDQFKGDPENQDQAQKFGLRVQALFGGTLKTSMDMANNPIQEDQIYLPRIQEENNAYQEVRMKQTDRQIYINNEMIVGDDIAEFVEKEEKLDKQQRKALLVRAGTQQSSNQKKIQDAINLETREKKKKKNDMFVYTERELDNISQISEGNQKEGENLHEQLRFVNGEVAMSKKRNTGKTIRTNQKKNEGNSMSFDPAAYIPNRSQIFNKKGSKKNVTERSANILADQFTDRYLQQFYPSQRQAFIVIPTTLFHYDPPAVLRNAKNLNGQAEGNGSMNQPQNRIEQVGGFLQQKAGQNIQNIYGNQLYQPQAMAAHEDPVYFFETLDADYSKKRDLYGMRENKEKMAKYVIESQDMETCSTFSKIYSQYSEKQGYISPALSFLTCLHIANQKVMKIVSTEDQTDFYILDDRERMQEYNQLNQSMGAGNKQQISRDKMDVQEAINTQQNNYESNLLGGNKKKKQNPIVYEIID